jgi:hypothetical protein
MEQLENNYKASPKQLESNYKTSRYQLQNNYKTTTISSKQKGISCG